jgi:hypothetical protein
MKSYAALLSAPSFSIGIECNADEITGISYLEPQPEVAPKTPLGSWSNANRTGPSNPPARVTSQRSLMVPSRFTLSVSGRNRAAKLAPAAADGGRTESR